MREVFGGTEGKVLKKPGETVGLVRKLKTSDFRCEHKEQVNREKLEVAGGVEGAQYKVGIREKGKGEDDSRAED